MKVVATVATQNWDYVAGFDVGAKMRWEWDAGAYVQFLETRPLSFLAEVHYIQKGFGEELRHSTVYHPDSQDCEDFGPPSTTSRPRSWPRCATARASPTRSRTGL